MKLLTCNIRFSSMGHDTGVRFWKNRRDFCLETMLSRQPDIICVQECHNDQFTDLQAGLGSGWSAYWVMSFPDGFYPENAIFYRKDFARIVNCGGYWLSETPHIPGSRSWGSECVRLANYAVFDTPEGRIRVVNTHLDHASQTAREKQADMLNADAAAWPADLPQILTGDLNCDFSNPAVQRLLGGGWHDTHAEATGICDERFTFHGFLGEHWQGDPDPGPCGNGKMDWILARGPIRTLSSEIIKDHAGDLYPSDHYFVFSELKNI